VNNMADEPTIIRDIRHAILNDEYMWICIWGEPRTGKSSLALLIMYYIYRDWDKVMQAIGFSLGQILYKIKNGIPEKWTTLNGLHNRIPVMLWDDFGAHSNKAKTQHQRSWDLFKGGFDVLGTKIGVLLATMVMPSEPTQQISEKYTHEVWIENRGTYKYDRWRQQQDYTGFRSRGSKVWLDIQDFIEVPMEQFKRYDELRQSLADEIMVAIEDSMAETEMGSVKKRLQPSDVEFMRLIEARGPISPYVAEKEFGPLYDQVLTRLKARGLIIPIKSTEASHHRDYDLTQFGIDLLKDLANENQQNTG